MKKSSLFLMFSFITVLIASASSYYLITFGGRQVDATIQQNKLKKAKRQYSEALVAKAPTLNEANGATTRVFMAMVTYSSQESYDQRKDTVKDLLSSDVYNSDQAFSKDSTKQVTALHLTSTYKSATFYPDSVSNGVATGKVLVSYDGAFKDDNAAQGQVAYQVTYDATIHKFTDITFLGKYNLATDSTLY